MARLLPSLPVTPARAGPLDVRPAPVWTSILRAAAGAVRVRLVAFPHAGAGPGALASLLGRCPTGVEVVGVTGPGRERRLADRAVGVRPDPAATVAAVVAELADRPARPTVLLGHSMGAALAAAVAVAVRPCATVLSAYPAPGSPAQRAGRWSDSELLTILRAGDRTPADVLDSAAWRAHLLGLLRHDLTLGVRLVATTDLDALPGPVTLLHGADDPLATPCRARPGWTATTLPGGHFALFDVPAARDAAAAEIRAHLTAAG